MLTESSIISVIGIIVAAAGYFVPLMSMLVLIAGVPYAVISYRNGIKNGIMGAVISFIILAGITDPVNAMFLLTTVYIPSAIMGGHIKNQPNMFEPVSKSFIMSLIGVIFCAKLMAAYMGIDIRETLDAIFMQAMTIKNPYIEMIQPNVDQNQLQMMFARIRMIFPSMVILQSIMMSFVTYFATAFIIKRTTRERDAVLPSFKNMTLPGNIAVGLFIIYLLSMLVKSTDIVSYKLLSVNLMTTMGIIFFIQGIAVMDYLLERARVKTFFKRVLMVGSIIIAQFSIVVSILGVIDSIVNFRRMKR